MADFDVIVVGSGVGGGAVAARLSDAGRRVLVLERGLASTPLADRRDEHRMLIERVASDDRPMEIGGVAARPLIGGVPGGGSALYGAALLRPSPEDFVPGRYYGDRVPRAIWEWPYSFEDLARYFDRAEDLFGVSGDSTARVPHLARRDHPYRHGTPPLDSFNADLARRLRARGAAPFALPLAIDFDKCLLCARCPGYGCPTGARTSSHETLLVPRAREGRIDYRFGVEAERISVRRRRFESLRFRDRRTGDMTEATADHVVLASGAIGTPLLLADSDLGAESGELGRNHMCHLGALAVTVFPGSIGADKTYLKRLGLTDFYFGTSKLEAKMGSAQAVPVPGVASMAHQVGLPLPRSLAAALHRRTLLMAGYVEDLPSAANRVWRRRDGTIRIERSFDRFDVIRARALARALAWLMRRAGAALSIPWVAKNDRDHLAHQVGTCRAGADPATSVVDSAGRLHGHEGIWVADGSVLPTSLGVGPALTIAAHALRVADFILEEQPA